MEAAILPSIPLDPRYRPADQDLYVTVRFVGNTAAVADITLGRVTVGHLAAAIDALEDAKTELKNQAKARAGREGILTTGQMPPPDIGPRRPG